MGHISVQEKRQCTTWTCLLLGCTTLAPLAPMDHHVFTFALSTPLPPLALLQCPVCNDGEVHYRWRRSIRRADRPGSAHYRHFATPQNSTTELQRRLLVTVLIVVLHYNPNILFPWLGFYNCDSLGSQSPTNKSPYSAQVD